MTGDIIHNPKHDLNNFWYDKLNKLNKSQQFKDLNELVVLITSLYEIEKSFNLLLREINHKLDLINHKLNSLQPSPKEELTELDKNILEFIRKMEIVDAEDIRRYFNYKGKNAASARLNHLYKLGYLLKIREGKKVKYKLVGDLQNNSAISSP